LSSKTLPVAGLTVNMSFNGKVHTLRRITVLLCTGAVACILSGCQKSGSRQLLVVDFKPDTTLTYRLTSHRDITLELKSEDPKMKGKNTSQTMSEELELVIAYTPLEVDPFGITTIQGKCRSAKVTRRSFTGKAGPGDAVEQLAGKTFTIKLSPTGKIADYSSLTEVVRDLGNKAFATNTAGNQKVKNPDMIYDFIAMQWYLWDSTATIDNPLRGVRVGSNWQASQLVPLPIPIIAVRDTTYTLQEITETPDGRKAVISSSYVLSDKKLANWPKPYSERFAMKGMFGFLRNYKYQSLEGQGKQIFNIDTGVVESEQQHYRMTISAAFLLPLGDSVPIITIDQKINVELLDDKSQIGGKAG